VVVQIRPIHMEQVMASCYS